MSIGFATVRSSISTVARSPANEKNGMRPSRHCALPARSGELAKVEAVLALMELRIRGTGSAAQGLPLKSTTSRRS
jgi:hypothetical protein